MSAYQRKQSNGDGAGNIVIVIEISATADADGGGLLQKDKYKDGRGVTRGGEVVGPIRGRRRVDGESNPLSQLLSSIRDKARADRQLRSRLKHASKQTTQNVVVR